MIVCYTATLRAFAFCVVYEFMCIPFSYLLVSYPDLTSRLVRDYIPPASPLGVYICSILGCMDTFSVQGGEYVFESSWGEQLNSVVDPRPVLLNLSSEECVVMETEKMGDLSGQ